MKNFSPSDVDYLLSPAAIRDRARRIYGMALDGGTSFRVHPEKVENVADYVLKVIRDNYPDLEIPYHSRHGHLNAGGVDRVSLIESTLGRGLGGRGSPREIAQSKIDLVVVSVLVDAGAGDKWKYYEDTTGKTYARSEGLAVASFHMFARGAFSSDKENLLRADIGGLKRLRVEDLAKGFQVGPDNPLIGIEGRVHLLKKLGEVMEARPHIFKNGRVGDLLIHLLDRHGEDGLRARHVLDFVLRELADIWPARLKLGNQGLGDVWSYPALGAKDSLESLVPFHKLSQWLTYSLLVPIIELLGREVPGVEELTGLAEYRNGGLMIDSGLLELRQSADGGKPHSPDSQLIIEWRALTVAMLDLLADSVRKKLGKSPTEMPLAKVLEGGTWHAGRRIAKEKRASGEPPLNIVSDGTVF